MNKKYIWVLVVLVIIAIIVFWQKPNTNTVENPEVGNELPTEESSKNAPTFSGTITSVDTGCFVDAVCSVTVDGKKVILVTGGLAMSPDAKIGKLIGVESIGDLEQKIGAQANVYAALTPEGDYTLYGNSDYYVEVLAAN
jgi:hypothetical protein